MMKSWIAESMKWWTDEMMRWWPLTALLPILSSVHVEIGPSAPYPIIYNTKWPSGHPKSGPKSIKNRAKRASKSISKVIEKHVEIGIDFLTIFGPFWPPTWGAPGVQRIRCLGSSWLPVGSSWLQGPKMAPRAHPSSISGRSGPILGRCWVDVESILSRCWSILGRC